MLDMARALQDWLERNGLPLDGVTITVQFRDVIERERARARIAADVGELTGSVPPLRPDVNDALAYRGTINGIPFALTVPGEAPGPRPAPSCDPLRHHSGMDWLYMAVKPLTVVPMASREIST